MIIVSEPGIYRLIFASKKPAAERVQDWIYHEVLPSIRRTGRYQAGGKREKNVVQQWTDQRNAACRVDAVRRTHGVRAAAEVAMTILAELGYNFSDKGPDQGELDLKVVGGTDIEDPPIR